MNGINYSTLTGNAGLYSNQANIVKDEMAFKGKITGGKEQDKKQTKQAADTVEISGQSRVPQAGYERPKRVVQQQNTYKELNEEGIQEGITLSEEAQSLLKELREKYANMDIYVANWSSDEEQDYYATQGTKEYSVLIAPEALESMAADAEVRSKYEAILDQTGENFDTLKEELGEDFEKVKSFSVTIDRDGKVTYAVKLLQDLEESSHKRAEQNRKAQEERAQEKRAEEKKEKKKAQEEQRLERIEADSIEGLIQAIKAKLYPEAEEVETEEIVTEEAQEQMSITQNEA